MQNQSSNPIPLPVPVLHDEAPRFIERLIQLFDGQATGASHATLISAHAKGNSLGDIVGEYFALRRVVIEALERALPLLPQERELLHSEFESAISGTISSYPLRQSMQAEIAGWAHDLRNPLTTAMLLAEHLGKHSEQSEKTRSLSAKIVENIDRADRMIRDLLDVSCMQSGESGLLKRENCSLRELAESVIGDLSVIYGERFKLRAQGDLRGNWGSVGVRRAIENLLSNSIKYGSPTTEVTIVLENRREDVAISVHNFGEMIGPEDQKMIFLPFKRTRAAQESGKQGWGLGLLLVKAIAEGHGGRVEVESSQPAGTTFRMILPKSY